MIYQGRGSEEQATKKRRPPAKIANRLRPHLVRWRAIDARRSADLRAAGLMKAGEQIRFIVNRMHDGQPLAGKIRSAWEGILEDAGLGEDVVRHSLRHTAATWQMQAGTDLWEAAMARHDRRAVRTELRPPPSRLSRGRGGGLRGTTLDIPSVDNCCSEHSDTSGQSGARAPLNAIVSTRLAGAPSTSHARSLGTVTRSPAGCGSEELPQIGGKHAC
jgi:hypothetical protein